MASQALIAFLVSCYVCLLLATPSNAAVADITRHKRSIDRQTAIAVLETLLSDLQVKDQQEKRNLDMGYGSRYGVAQSVGSKLLALKYATDWNSPGRKRSTSPVTSIQLLPANSGFMNRLILSYRRRTYK